VDCGDMN